MSEQLEREVVEVRRQIETEQARAAVRARVEALTVRHGPRRTLRYGDERPGGYVDMGAYVRAVRRRI